MDSEQRGSAANDETVAAELPWLRLLASACTEGIVVHEGGRILRANDALAAMLGYLPQQLIGMDATALTVPADRARIMAHIAAERSEPLAGMALRQDGSTFPAELVGRSVTSDDDGRSVRVVIVRDITDRLHAERAERARVAYHDLVLRQLPGALWTTDAALRVTTVKGADSAAPPVDARTRLGLHVREQFLPGEDASVAEHAHERALAGESVGFRVVLAGRTYDAHVEPLRDADGVVIGVVGTRIDTTSAVEAAERARESELRFQQVVDHLQEVFWVIDLHHDGTLRVEYLSPAFATLWGIAPEAVYQDASVMFAAVHADDREPMLRTIPEAMREPRSLDFRMHRPDGEERWLSARGYPVLDVRNRAGRVIGLSEDITARKATEAALRQRERELASLAEHSPDVITRYDRAHRVCFMNRAIEPIMGQPAESYLGRTLHELGVPSETSATWEALNDEVLRTGESRDLTFQVTTASGEVRHYHAAVVPERDASGAVTHVLVTSRDVTQRVRAEARARAADATLHSLAEQTLTGIYVIKAGRFAYVNPRFLQIFGYASIDALNALPEVALIIHPADRERVRENLRVREGGESIAEHYSFRGLRADGETIDVEVFGSRSEYDGQPAVVGTLLDVTERARAGAALAESEARFRGMFDRSAVAVTLLDRDGVFVDVNPAMAALMGYAQSELRGQPSNMLSLSDDAALTRLPMRDVWAGLRTHFYVEKQFRRKDGRVIWGALSVARVDGPDGTPRFTVGMISDITAQREAEAALQARERRFRALVEFAQDLIALLEPDGRLRYASPAYVSVLGLHPESMVGKSAYAQVHRDERPALQEFFERAASHPGRPTALQHLRFRHADGTYRTLAITLTDMRGEPAVGAFVANSRDVTEQQRLEEQLRHAQKMEAVGQLAGGVAHDFNNILAAITAYAQMLTDSIPAEHPWHADATEIARAAARGAGVTRQLLAFSRRQAIETEVLDLVAVVRDTGRMLRSLLPSTITLDLPPRDAAPAWVRATSAQLEQIVLNLAVNARDVMPRGGVLAIEVRPGPHAAVDGGATVLLTVRDTGSGIPAAVRERIFDPFFTTKPLGQGTGLGLSTVYGLVRQFGGTVTVESVEGEGAEFTITLPATERPERAAETHATAPPSHAAGAGLRVLLVEDEPQLRTVARRVLAKEGYEVMEARDGAEAIAILQAGAHVDVVLTDAAMPVMGGRELAERVVTLRPGVPVVLMSGYAELSGATGTPEMLPTVSGAVGNVPGVVAFVEKPFTIERLLGAVRAALRPG